MNMKHYDDADGLHMVLMRLDEWDEHERLADERIAVLEAELSEANANLSASRTVGANLVGECRQLRIDLAAARAAAHAWKRAAKFWYFAQPDDDGEWERWQEYRYRRELFKPVLSEE